MKSRRVYVLNNIDISITGGLAIDGTASAMSSNISCVQARIREAVPLALYTPITNAMFLTALILVNFPITIEIFPREIIRRFVSQHSRKVFIKY